MAQRGLDYIPRSDGSFAAWAAAFYDAVKAWWTAQGLDKHGLDELLDALNTWALAYAANVAAQAAAEAAATAKAQARTALEAQLRPIAAFVQTYPATTNAERATMGLTVRDAIPTRVPTPTSRPIVRVVGGQRLQHEIRFSDESTPTRRAKPRGTTGAEVWLALVEVNEPPPPLGESYRFLALRSAGDALATFKSQDAGKQACYALRWVSTRGEKGPWSEVCSATVAA